MGDFSSPYSHPTHPVPSSRIIETSRICFNRDVFALLFPHEYFIERLNWFKDVYLYLPTYGDYTDECAAIGVFHQIKLLLERLDELVDRVILSEVKNLAPKSLWAQRRTVQNKYFIFGNPTVHILGKNHTTNMSVDICTVAGHVFQTVKQSRTCTDESKFRSKTTYSAANAHTIFYRRPLWRVLPRTSSPIVFGISNTWGQLFYWADLKPVRFMTFMLTLLK